MFEFRSCDCRYESLLLSASVSTSGGIRIYGHVCVVCLALCPAYGSARWQVAVEVRAFQGVDAYAHLRCSPWTQINDLLWGLGGTESYSCFGRLSRTGTIYIPWAVGGQVGFYIPKLHISLSGAFLGNLKMQYCCHQLEEDTEPE